MSCVVFSRSTLMLKASDRALDIAVRKTPVLEPFLYKMIILPRQASDKHRKS
eukprot:COSAG02_NODE_1337_length_13193_cov_9.142050_6_plen_52_part_00